MALDTKSVGSGGAPPSPYGSVLGGVLGRSCVFWWGVQRVSYPLRWRLRRRGKRDARVARREGEVEFAALPDLVGFFHFRHVMEGSRIIDKGQDEGGGYLDAVPGDIFLDRREGDCVGINGATGVLVSLNEWLVEGLDNGVASLTDTSGGKRDRNSGGEPREIGVHPNVGEAALSRFQREVVVKGEGGGAGFQEGCGQRGACFGEGGRREVFVAGDLRLSLFVHRLFQSGIPSLQRDAFQ